ncbi:MAG: multicopper oxidase domain-containing protein [Pseudanabaenaceae cyanobacterium bins.68]|nr:multicopper oxidase domain-containing protein [Pseudanabaenaceae cyanobacterium bins.68]
MVTPLDQAYVIGSQNFKSWSQNFDPNRYLRVLPHPETKVPFKSAFQDWQTGKPGNYFSSWGANPNLVATLNMDEINEIKIEGFGTLRSGDGVIPWLNNSRTPYEQLAGYNGTIPGPMIITEPGDTLNIRLQNSFKQTTNFHAHGLHVSPMGRGDNVLHSVAPAESWQIKLEIPEDHDIGLDWYHPHLHGLTNEQVASGIAGQLVILAPHDIPDLDKFDPRTNPFFILSLNTFGIQQVDRQGAAGDPLNQNPNQVVPAGTPLQVNVADTGEFIYQLSDAPFMGYNAKPLSYDPTKPTGDPSQNLSYYGGGALAEPTENVIHTVNGQYNPTLDLVTGNWNAFNFSNMNSNAFHLIQLVKQVGDRLVPQDLQVIALDGDASGTIDSKTREVTVMPVMGPGQRVTVQKWFEEPGTYYFLSNGTEELLGDATAALIKGKKGFEDGHLIWSPQVLATVVVEGKPIPEGNPPEPYDVIVEKAKEIDQLISKGENNQTDRERTFIWSANIGGALAQGNIPDDLDPISFEGAYRINGNYFATNFSDSMVPLTMPMLNTSEVWNMVNSSGALDPNLPPQINIPLLEWHPFHIHQNDFTVLSINGIPTSEVTESVLSGVLQDTISLSPTYDPKIAPTRENPYGVPMIGGTPSQTRILMEFSDFPGNFVNHCHILFHEDAGMMAPVRVILNTEDTWLGSASNTNNDGEVILRRAHNPGKSTALLPFGDSFRGNVEVAIADINFIEKPKSAQNVTDNVTDVAVIQSTLPPDQTQFTVKVFDGKSLMAESSQTKVNGNNSNLLISQFNPFLGQTFTTKTKTAIAAGDINGDGHADIVVGISNSATEIEIYSGKDFSLMARLSPFTQSPSFHGTFNLSTGDIDGDNFEDILVSGHGLVEIYGGKDITTQGSLDGKATALRSSMLSGEFEPYGKSHAQIEITSGYILQRPDIPNGAATQTYHANITTMIKGEVPAGHEAIKVFTFVGGAHHGGHGSNGDHADHGSTSPSSGSSSNHGSHGSSSTANPASSHSTPSGVIPQGLRLDTEFTPLQKVDSLFGTFADLPGLPRGEPVLYLQNLSGTTDIIHLGAGNSPSQISTSFLITSSSILS